ncbi:hypothetical protein FOA43_001456 [Brettanomyces nanus]|uniref:AP-2 complex subunit alpha n=1 Tax=Eeniella nana TaxID=13502 RepID=A0A875S4F5_EENNA|nr:uncharacterized protein FOA43_001456 [Brettanomyces nanus]QPG74134.1 hypothetical protein FOA43_001456 [Brettanomyces nanus]
MAPQMKGLVQFITDIRNAKEVDDEQKRIQTELVHIQKQFQQSNLSGYHRKKYICKLLYIYLLGHPLDFGFNEAIELAKSINYSEKTIGYLALAAFIKGKQGRNGDETSDSQWQSICEALDIDFSSPNAEHVCLALSSVVDLCDYRESLVKRYETRVFGAMVSPEFDFTVKKKAALTMYKFVRVDSDAVSRHPEIISRAVPLINSESLSLVLGAIPLLEVCTRLDYKACEPCITLAINKLYELIVEKKCPEGYHFHGTAAPWVVVKLFRLLEALVPDASSSKDILDKPNMNRLDEILKVAVSSSIECSSDPDSSVEARNVSGSVLFGALSLSAHIIIEEEQEVVAADSLCVLLKSPDINTRYLSLGTLLQIAARNDKSSVAAIYKHFSLVSLLLRDRDVSIRRRALDLVYMVCNSNNIEKICSELLKYLAIAEFSMKSEVAVKVAILAENFATDATWFVVTIAKLLALAGNYVEDDVWCRMAQIIVNNDQIQPTACRTMVRYLKGGQYPESMLRLGSFVLSEFGQLIEDVTPLTEQFSLLYVRYPQSSVLTRAMLLSAFFKYYFKCEKLRPQLKKVFEEETNSFSSEIQQRALEYLALVEMNDPAVLKLIVVDMPPFASKVSPLISRLGTVEALKQTFKLAEPTERNPELEEQETPVFEKLLATSEAKLIDLDSGRIGTTIATGMAAVSRPAPPPPRNKRRATVNSLSDTGTLSATSTGSNDNSRRSSVSLLHYHEPVLSPTWKEGYYRLCRFDQGIFFENSLIRIVYRLKRDRSTLHISLNYTNKSPSTITGLTGKVILPKQIGSEYVVNVVKHPDSTIPEKSRTNQLLDVMIRSMYRDASVPIIHISFMSGGLSNIKLKLPIILFKGMCRGAPLSKEVFLNRWTQIVQTLGSKGEAQRMIKLTKPTTTVALGRLITLIGFDNLPQVDANPYNIAAAGILNAKTQNFGCLMRLELSPNDNTLVGLTIRCTTEGLSDIFAESLSDVLTNE